MQQCKSTLLVQIKLKVTRLEIFIITRANLLCEFFSHYKSIHAKLALQNVTFSYDRQVTIFYTNLWVTCDIDAIIISFMWSMIGEKFKILLPLRLNIRKCYEYIDTPHRLHCYWVFCSKHSETFYYVGI